MVNALDSSLTKVVSSTDNKVGCQLYYDTTAVSGQIPSTTITKDAITSMDPVPSHSLNRRDPGDNVISTITITKSWTFTYTQVNTVYLPTSTNTYIESVTGDCSGTTTYFASYKQGMTSTSWFTVAPAQSTLFPGIFNKRDV